MACRNGVVADNQFFVQLFARTQAGDADFDVAFGIGRVFHVQAAQPYHLPRQVDDFYRFAHVQNKYVAAFAHRARLYHQLGGFGDGHKVAGDVGMGKRNGPAGGDLLLEGRNDRTGRTQYVAEAHHAEAGLAVRFRRQGLQDEFGHAFARAHSVGGTHGFVGGN